MVKKGTSNSEAVVCRKFRRRKQERQKLPSLLNSLFSLVILRVWMKHSETRGHWCSAAHRIFNFAIEKTLLSDFSLWSRSLLLNLFDPEDTWLRSSFFPDTWSFWTAGGTTCGQRNKIHLSSPRCQRSLTLTPVSCAHQHAYSSAIWGGEWCTSFTSWLGMEHGGVLLSFCLTQHTVSSVSPVLTSTISTLQIQKVTMHYELHLLSQNCLWKCNLCCGITFEIF